MDRERSRSRDTEPKGKGATSKGKGQSKGLGGRLLQQGRQEQGLEDDYYGKDKGGKSNKGHGKGDLMEVLNSVKAMAITVTEVAEQIAVVERNFRELTEVMHSVKKMAVNVTRVAEQIDDAERKLLEVLFRVA